MGKGKVKTPSFIVKRKNLVFPLSNTHSIYEQGARLLNTEFYHKVYKLTGEGMRYVVYDDGYNQHNNLSVPESVKAYGHRVTHTPSGHGNMVHGVIGMQGRPIISMQPHAVPTHKKYLHNGGDYKDLTKALRDAREAGHTHGVISSGSDPRWQDKDLLKELRLCRLAGMKLAVAGGNEGMPNRDVPISFPANSPDVFCAVAIEFDDDQAPYSNEGDQADFAIYGSEIYTTNKDGGHDEVQGSSFSAPYLLGVILTYDQYFIRLYGRLATWDEMYQILKTYAVDLGGEGFDKYFGHGRVTLRGIDDNFKLWSELYRRNIKQVGCPIV
jgi:hypothetical protein